MSAAKYLADTHLILVQNIRAPFLQIRHATNLVANETECSYLKALSTAANGKILVEELSRFQLYFENYKQPNHCANLGSLV